MDCMRVGRSPREVVSLFTILVFVWSLIVRLCWEKVGTPIKLVGCVKMPKYRFIFWCLQTSVISIIQLLVFGFVWCVSKRALPITISAKINWYNFTKRL